MGAPQRNKVQKIQTSYVIQQEKQEHKKAQQRKKKRFVLALWQQWR